MIRFTRTYHVKLSKGYDIRERKPLQIAEDKLLAFDGIADMNRHTGIKCVVADEFDRITLFTGYNRMEGIYCYRFNQKTKMYETL